MDAVYGIMVDSSGVETGVRRAQRALNKLPKETRKVAREMGKSFDAVKNSIFSIRGAIVSAFAGLSFASIIGEGRRFGEALGDLSAITGATGDDLDFLSDKARQFGKENTLSAVEAAKAFKLIASAKPDLLESGAALAQVTEQAIKLAEAAGQDLPAAANALGASLNQFASGADNAARFVNVLAAGSKFGAASVAETSEALKFAGTVANDAGVSFETTVAAIQQLSKVAIKGGEAGTGLRNIIIRLAAAGKRELDPAVVGLTQALKNLNAENLTTVELTELVGLRSVVALKALVNNTAALEELEGQVTDTNIALEQQAARLDNLDGDIKKMSSAYSELKIAIELASDEGLRKFTQSMTEMFLKLGENIDQVLKMAKSIGILIASIASARLLGPIIGAVASGLFTLVKALGAFRAGLAASQLAMAATIGGLTALKAAFAFLGGPVGVILVAVGAVYAWITATKEAKVDTDNYASSLDSLRGSMADFSKEKIDLVIQNQQKSLRDLNSDLANTREELAKQREVENKKFRGGQTAARQQKARERIIELLAEEQRLTDLIADGNLLIAELGEQRLDVTQPGSAQEDAVDNLNKMADAADALEQSARTAFSGLFPNREEIARLREAQDEITRIQNELKEAPPEVVADLKKRGVTLESLAEAYAKLESNIAKVGKKEMEASGIAKAYNSELQNLDRALAKAEIAASGQANATESQRVAFELANGKLKELTDSTKKKALADKAAAVDAARLTATVVQQTMEMSRANDLAEIAAKNDSGQLTQQQAVAYELAHGRLKDFNDEKQRAALLDEAARADAIALDKALNDQADAVKDQLDPLREYNRQIEKLSVLQKAGKITQEEYTAAAREAALQHNEAAQIIKNEFGTVFADVINGTKSMTEAFRDMAGNIIKQLNDLAAKKIGDQLFNTLFSPGAAEEGTMGITKLFSGVAGGAQAAAPEGGGAASAISQAVSAAQPLPVEVVNGGVTGAGDMLGSLAGGDAANDPALAAAETTQAEISSGFSDVFTTLKTGASSVWDSVSTGFGDLMGNIGQGFSGLWSGIQGLFSGGGGGGGGAIGNIAQAAIGAFAGGGARYGGTFTASDLKGYANGGDFRVGGAGGLDSQVVAFRASPNETVTVARPQDTNKNKSVNVTNNFNIAAPNGQVSESSQQQIAGRVQQSIALAQRRTL